MWDVQINSVKEQIVYCSQKERFVREAPSFTFAPAAIPFPSVRVSFKSANQINKNKEYHGIIIFNIGTYNAKQETGYNIFPGWVYFKDSTELGAGQN